MPIEHSVGTNGVNKTNDARIVQRLLNADLARRSKPLLAVDGLVGPKTIAAITDYQRYYQLPFIDGRVNKDGPTIRDLVSRSYYMLLRGFVPLSRRRGIIIGPVDGIDCDYPALTKYLTGIGK